MICFESGLGGLVRGPRGVEDVSLVCLVGDGEGKGAEVWESWWRWGPGRREVGMSVLSGERVVGGGGGRLGWRCAVVDTERLRVVFRGNGTGLSSMGGGSSGAPGKSTLRLCDSSRAMIVLALAEVSFSFVEGVARGVEEAV